ncbi:MAG: DNA gyrase C-terminal beta-propeller domain-containing protein, partial [Desulfotomaculaceae bacterium]|nr:DNA gyrase C-terminal beta-propeller domain-containing protein [Desulfotomaculaceae bacterium]
SAEGIIIRLKAGDISTIGRSTQGVTLMRMDQGDLVVAVAKVYTEE